MPKKIIKSKSKSKITKSKLSKKPKYAYLLALIALLALGYGAFKAFGPKPVDINLVYSGSAPAVIIRDGVYTTDGKYVPPGTYAGNPCPSGQTTPCQNGRTISGQFFPWGTYGTIIPKTAEEIQAARSFTQAVYQAAGYTTQNPCGGDLYYYSTQSNQCKQLKEKTPTMYSPRKQCSAVKRTCDRMLVDSMSTSVQGSHNRNSNKNGDGKYLDSIESNTQTCYISQADCQQQNP